MPPSNIAVFRDENGHGLMFVVHGGHPSYGPWVCCACHSVIRALDEVRIHVVKMRPVHNKTWCNVVSSSDVEFLLDIGIVAEMPWPKS
jgi:hypothetical protein